MRAEQNKLCPQIAPALHMFAKKVDMAQGLTVQLLNLITPRR